MISAFPNTADVSSAAADPQHPVRVSPKSGWQLFREVLDHGGPGYLQFAITNICNAKCDFCNFAVDRFDPRHHRSVTLEQARDVIEIARRNHIGYMLFQGGEPLVHKDLLAMVRFCAEAGIHPLICTNGSLWTDRNMRAFAENGLSSVIMSVDAHDVRTHEENRGLPDLCRKIQRANKAFASLGVQTTASVTASKLIEDYRKLPGFLRALGFESCTFSYPLTFLASSFLSFSDSRLVSYTTDELIGVFDKIKQMKSESGFPVVNPTESLTEMQRHLRREPERFGCLAGYKYFYLDWNLNLYRCHAWEKPMCSIYDFDSSKLIRDGCTRCMIDCFRDSSVLQFVAISTHDAYQHLKEGKVLTAAKDILDRRNLVSIRAVWDDRKWIGKTLARGRRAREPRREEREPVTPQPAQPNLDRQLLHAEKKPDVDDYISVDSLSRQPFRTTRNLLKGFQKPTAAEFKRGKEFVRSRRIHP